MAAWLVLGVSLLAWAGACGGPSKQAGAGEQCFRVTDCELGLICGPDQKCTSDLTAIDIRPDASRGGDASAGGGSGGGTPDSSSSTASGGSAGMSSGAGGASAAGNAGTSSGGSDADAAE